MGYSNPNQLTLHRLGVYVGIGEVGSDTQGAAIGTGLDAGCFQEQRCPGRPVS